MGISEDFEIDTETYEIRHVLGNKQYSVTELCRWLVNWTDEDLTVPAAVTRISDTKIRLLNPYFIKPKSLTYLRHGTIFQEKNSEIFTDNWVFRYSTEVFK